MPFLGETNLLRPYAQPSYLTVNQPLTVKTDDQAVAQPSFALFVGYSLDLVECEGPGAQATDCASGANRVFEEAGHLNTKSRAESVF